MADLATEMAVIARGIFPVAVVGMKVWRNHLADMAGERLGDAVMIDQVFDRIKSSFADMAVILMLCDYPVAYE